MMTIEEIWVSEIEKLQQKHIERKMLYTHVIWMSFIRVFFLPTSPYRHTTLVLGILLSATTATAAATTTAATTTR